MISIGHRFQVVAGVRHDAREFQRGRRHDLVTVLAYALHHAGLAPRRTVHNRGGGLGLGFGLGDTGLGLGDGGESTARRRVQVLAVGLDLLRVTVSRRMRRRARRRIALDIGHGATGRIVALHRTRIEAAPSGRPGRNERHAKSRYQDSEIATDIQQVHHERLVCNTNATETRQRPGGVKCDQREAKP